MRGHGICSLILRFRCAKIAPPGPQQPVRKKKKKQTEERGEQMEKIEITNGEVDTEGAPETRRTHHRNNLHKASGKWSTTRHKQKQAPRRTQSPTEACAVVRDHRDQ